MKSKGITLNTFNNLVPGQVNLGAQWRLGNNNDATIIGVVFDHTGFTELLLDAHFQDWMPPPLNDDMDPWWDSNGEPKVPDDVYVKGFDNGDYYLYDSINGNDKEEVANAN